ncbi:MAG: putative toxin-antitoxin system toxin component, PIN family [Chloroflexota bacterium]
MRVLLDTNVLISYLLTPNQSGSIAVIMEALLQDAFALLLPEELLAELDDVVARKPQLAKRIRPDQMARFREILRTIAIPIATIKQEIPAVTRDPKDDYLLAYAVVGEADYLVTGDNDLLILGTVGMLQIVSPPVFAAVLKSQHR